MPPSRGAEPPHRRLAVVITTISDGRFMEGLRPLLEAADGALSLIVVGDENTPPSCGPRVLRAAADGHEVTWLAPAAQRDLLAQAPGLDVQIPWRSDNRRNVGVLDAWRRGFDVVVTVDDDNVPLNPAEFVRIFRDVGRAAAAPQVVSPSRWINVCDFLDCRSSRRPDEPVHVFPRGHPISRRERPALSFEAPDALHEVALHLGLWIGEPDVDAATRAAVAPVSLDTTLAEPVILPAGALCATSTQNLAAAHRLVPAWWNVRMGPVAPGLTMDRFGDILQGCFAAMAIAAMGERIAVGRPLVRHVRNPHSLLRDLALELPGMALLEALLPMVEAGVGRAASYPEAYLRVAHSLTDHARCARPHLWGDHLPPWADATAATMESWVQACQALSPAEPSPA